MNPDRDTSSANLYPIFKEADATCFPHLEKLGRSAGLTALEVADLRLGLEGSIEKYGPKNADPTTLAALAVEVMALDAEVWLSQVAHENEKRGRGGG